MEKKLCNKSQEDNLEVQGKSGSESGPNREPAKKNESQKDAPDWVQGKTRKTRRKVLLLHYSVFQII